MNDPTVCGRIAGEVLANYSTRFKRVVFTGDPDFHAAAIQGFASGGRASPSTETLRRGNSMLKGEEAHLYVGSCVVCEQGLGSSDFCDLAILLDTSHKSHEMQFLHSSCMSNARQKFPKHQRMLLPDITKNAKSFLAALDLNGNGFVEKAELKCICALLWDGELPRDREAFEKDFETRFAMWDADSSENLNMKQITSIKAVAPTPGNTAAAPSKGTGKGAGKGIALDSVPIPCIEWVQEQAKRKKQAASKPSAAAHATGR